MFTFLLVCDVLLVAGDEGDLGVIPRPVAVPHVWLVWDSHP